MGRSVSGIIGAAVLAAAALLAEQTQPAEEPAASAAANTTQPVSQSLGLIIYPAKGQSASQQSVDEQECYNWAKTQTGIDPGAPAPAPAASEESKPKGGQRVRGAARGAAAGAIVGEVADDDADEGAKVGAAAGVIAGGRKAREDKRAHEQQSKDAAAAAETERQATFKKAIGACLQGRGYTAG